MIANFDQEMQSQSWDAAIQAYTATETAAQQTSAKAEQILYIRDDEYHHLEEDSYQAESLAEDAYQQYRTAESKSALLAAEVDDKRTAAKLSAAYENKRGSFYYTTDTHTYELFAARFRRQL